MIKISRVKIKDFIFTDIPIFLLSFNYILYNALPYSNLKNGVRIIALMLIFTGWALNANFHLSKTEALFAMLAFFELLIHGIQSVNLVALIGFSICNKRSLHDDIKRMFGISLLLCGLMLLLLRLGLVRNMSYISTLGRARSTLGFNNPNVGALFYSSPIFLYLLSRRKIHIFDLLMAGAAAFLIFYFTNSRTTFVSLGVYLIMIGLSGLEEKGWKISVDKICRIIIESLFLVNFISVFYLPSLLRFDVLTSYRISSFIRIFEDAGLAGLILGGTELTVDSFYYMMLFSYGIIAYLFLAIATHYSVRILSNNKEYRMIAFLTSVFVCGIMESSIIRPEILSMLLVWKIIIKPDKLRESPI